MCVCGGGGDGGGRGQGDASEAAMLVLKRQHLFIHILSLDDFLPDDLLFLLLPTPLPSPSLEL